MKTAYVVNAYDSVWYLYGVVRYAGGPLNREILIIRPHQIVRIFKR